MLHVREQKTEQLEQQVGNNFFLFSQSVSIFHSHTQLKSSLPLSPIRQFPLLPRLLSLSLLILITSLFFFFFSLSLWKPDIFFLLFSKTHFHFFFHKSKLSLSLSETETVVATLQPEPKENQWPIVMLFLDFQTVVFWFSKFYFIWEYLPKFLLGWVTTRSLSLRRFVALPKIVQDRLSTTPPLG